MVDFLNPQERSQRMGAIRSKDTNPEVTLRRELHRLGLRFRLHAAHLPGKADIVLPRFRTAIFVHGCFWHRHSGCKVASTPKTNIDFWTNKFARNIERDKIHCNELIRLGWHVVIVWECQVKSKTRASNTAFILSTQIKSGNLSSAECNYLNFSAEY